MTRTNITYSESIETFHVLGLKKWRRAEISAAIDGSDNPLECLAELKKDVQSFLMSPMGATPEEALEGVLPQPPKKEINIAAERVAILIENSVTIEELATYKDDATKYAMNQQYMDKLRQLTNLNHKP